MKHADNPYLVCKKRIVGPGKTRGYPYPVCKKIKSSTAGQMRVHLCVVYVSVCRGLSQAGKKKG